MIRVWDDVLGRLDENLVTKSINIFAPSIFFIILDIFAIRKSVCLFFKYYISKIQLSEAFQKRIENQDVCILIWYMDWML